MDFGTNIVGGTSPGKGGREHLGKPVYNTVREAVRDLKPHVSSVFVPAILAADAIIEAIEAEVPLIVAYAEGVPTHDQLRIRDALQSQSRSRLVGANCPGMSAVVSKCKLGISPVNGLLPGKVGVAARSGTLSYEASQQLKDVGLGQSYVFGLGGDPFPGTRTAEALEFMLSDDSTEGIVLIGEIGGTMEEEVADLLSRTKTSKPIVGYIAGQSIPQSRTFGHAGALWEDGLLGAKDKIALWERAGIRMAPTPGDIGKVMLEVM